MYAIRVRPLLLATRIRRDDVETVDCDMAPPEAIYMKLSVDSLHQCEGFVLFCQTFSEDLSRGVSFS